MMREDTTGNKSKTRDSKVSVVLASVGGSKNADSIILKTHTGGQEAVWERGEEELSTHNKKMSSSLDEEERRQQLDDHGQRRTERDGKRSWLLKKGALCK
jgi:hypothetical protein